MNKDLWKLFSSFFKIGAFTFGGGYAMVPLIQKEAVQTHEWITDDDILNILAIAESTPGVLAVNSATFVGYKVAGFLGALCATIGVVLPSFVIISILSLFIMEFKELKWIAYAFEGIRVGVIVLMINAIFKLSKHCPKDYFNYIIMAVGFVLVAFLKIDIVLVLIAAAILGIVYHVITTKVRGSHK